jgi:hypothetical protein
MLAVRKVKFHRNTHQNGYLGVFRSKFHFAHGQYEQVWVSRGFPV